MEDHYAEAEQLLDELSVYNYPAIKPKVKQLQDILKPKLESERRKKIRAELNLKSSVPHDMLKVARHNHQLLAGVQTMHKRARDEVNFYDRSTSDLLHALELFDEDAELLAYTKDLKELRHMRREAKDFVELLAPLVSFASRHKDAIRDLRTAINDMEHIKNRMANRTYNPRERTDLEAAFRRANGVEEPETEPAEEPAPTEENEPTALEAAFNKANQPTK